ncbi:MAG: Rpn family recombination-promoting nuclease/putative transposase [Tannerella sp.]|jgi:predicted transposase/invertase (TIGR01784 family)|nr:Rpn family recombination-promoting nuclease/putative transposase [Tannerella sp.]
MKTDKREVKASEAMPDKGKGRPLVSFDWAIKRLLRNKANFEVVEGFLSELLGRSIRITSVLESESNKRHADDKYNRVDIMVEDAEKEILLIELQFMAEIDYLQRMLYGVSKAAIEHMVKKDEYTPVRKVYSINIVYFDLGQGNDYVYHGKTDFKGLHENDTLKLSQKQQNIFGKPEAGDLYPEYYILKINNFNDTATTSLDEWVYFLKHDRVEEGFAAKGLIKASEILDYSRLSPEEKSEYDYLQEQKSRYRSEVATAKDEGRDEGRDEAKKEYAKIIEEKDKALEEERKAREEERTAREEMAKEIEELKRLLQGKRTD